MRPGSVVSNIEQRLDDIEIFRGEGEGRGFRGEGEGRGYVTELSDLFAASVGLDGSSSSGGGGSGSAGGQASAFAESEYLAMLQQMQHRELKPADLQLLMLLEQQRTASRLPPFAPTSGHGMGWGGGSSADGGSAAEGWSAPPSLPAEKRGGSSASGSDGGGGSRDGGGSSRDGGGSRDGGAST